jgi:DNA-binding XRE family transcriptional regulator
MEKYKDADWLERKYWEENLTTHEMGDIVDMNHGTIVYWMAKHDIPRKNNIELIKQRCRKEYATYFTKKSGHEAWQTSDTEGGEDYCAVHRLAAVAWFGWDAVVGNDVHHDNNVPWDNREENLTPMGDREHMQHHAKEFKDKDGIEQNFGGMRDYDGVTPERIRELYHGEGLSQRQVAEELGVTRGIIRKRMEEWDIDRRGKYEGVKQYHK